MIVHQLSPMLMHILFIFYIYILPVFLLCCAWFVQVYKVYNLSNINIVKKITFKIMYFFHLIWYMHLNCCPVITLFFIISPKLGSFIHYFIYSLIFQIILSRGIINLICSPYSQMCIIILVFEAFDLDFVISAHYYCGQPYTQTLID